MWLSEVMLLESFYIFRVTAHRIEDRYFTKFWVVGYFHTVVIFMACTNIVWNFGNCLWVSHSRTNGKYSQRWIAYAWILTRVYIWILIFCLCFQANGKWDSSAFQYARDESEERLFKDSALFIGQRFVVYWPLFYHTREQVFWLLGKDYWNCTVIVICAKRFYDIVFCLSVVLVYDISYRIWYQLSEWSCYVLKPSSSIGIR